MSDPVAPLGKHLRALQKRLAAVEAKLGIAPPAGAGAEEDSEEEAPEWLDAFDELLSTQVQPVVDAAAALGGKGAELGAIIDDIFKAQRSVLALAATCKKSEQAAVVKRVPALQTATKAALDAAFHGKGTAFEHHFKALGEAVPAANWLFIPSLPHTWVESARDGAQMYLNKVLVAHRNTDGGAPHVSFATALRASMEGLYAFVKKHFKTGLAWNPRGKAVADADAGAGAAASAAAPVPKAAAAPAAPKATAKGDGATKAAAARTGLFAALRGIDQSAGKTAGLRHVTKDMKSKGASGAVAAKKKPAASGGAGAGARAAKKGPAKPPRLERVGKNWFCEYQVAGAPVEVTVEHRTENVYVYACDGATVIVHGKCNAMQIDKCVKTKVLFDAAVSSCSIVDCKRMQVQIKQNVPSLAIDKTDGCLVYMSYASRTAPITTSKRSELNVSIPSKEGDDADWTESPIPEQFVTELQADGTFTTRVSDLYSH